MDKYHTYRIPVESEEICVCVWQLNVDGCIWIGKVEREGEGGTV